MKLKLTSKNNGKKLNKAMGTTPIALLLCIHLQKPKQIVLYFKPVKDQGEKEGW